MEVFSSVSLLTKLFCCSRKNCSLDLLLFLALLLFKHIGVRKGSWLCIRSNVDLRHVQILVQANDGAWAEGEGQEVSQRVPEPELQENEHADN